MKIQFLGGAQTVTGSKTLLEIGDRRILIDCGLFQGLKNLRLKNWEPPPVDPKSVDAVLLTHAHLDHSGYLPAFVRDGFSGPIYSSAPTRDLTHLILMDSAKIQEEDADFANRHGYSKHNPARPLYGVEEAKWVFKLFQTLPSGNFREIFKGVRVRFRPSSHILGSTFIEVEGEGKRIVFSGDLGRMNPILYEPPSRIEEADYLVLESTYGDRNHRDAGEGAEKKLGRIIRATHEKGGQTLIPSFAVGRVQELLVLISNLMTRGEIPKMPIYLDSPLGTEATRIFTDFPEWHRVDRGTVDRLSRMTEVLDTRAESIRVMRDAKPAVIIAGSGMISGGRILHHLEARMGDSRATVVVGCNKSLSD